MFTVFKLAINVEVKFHILLSLKILIFFYRLTFPLNPLLPPLLPFLFYPFSTSSPQYAHSLLPSLLVVELFTWLVPQFE